VKWLPRGPKLRRVKVELFEKIEGTSVMMHQDDVASKVHEALEEIAEIESKCQTIVIDKWLLLGEALLVGRAWAMKQARVSKPYGKGYVTAFSRWLEESEFKTMEPNRRVSLMTLAENKEEVLAWFSALPEGRRSRPRNPEAILQAWRRSMDGAPQGGGFREAYAILNAENNRLKKQIDEGDEDESEEDEYDQIVRLRDVDPSYLETVDTRALTISRCPEEQWGDWFQIKEKNGDEVAKIHGTFHWDCVFELMICAERVFWEGKRRGERKTKDEAKAELKEHIKSLLEA
jgi:hypothetical protein